MRIATSVFLVAVTLSVASPAFAQAAGTSSSRQRPAATAKPSPPLPKPKLNIRAFGAFDAEMMSASDTFTAVTGSPLMLGYGGGVEIVNLWKHLFVRGDYVTAASKGERAFVVGGEVVSTGIGVTVRASHLETGAGWRLAMRKHPKYTPYLGGAALFVNYSEKSDFELPTDSVKESFPGYSVFGGVDIQLSKNKRWYATAEAQYRLVPNAIGGGGTSAVYGETDLGGFVGRVMIGVNLKK